MIKEPQTSPSAIKTPGGNLIKTFVYVTDITPTLLDFANTSHPAI
jgi:arylsulfatase A-like enzyme